MKSVQVILVDKNDVPMGNAEKQEAHVKALCHRAFSVFILRKSTVGIEVLLQKRQKDKYHCGGLWTNTCCSHPAPGEETQKAAEVRLKEEMGFSTPLTHMGRFHYIAEFDNGLTENEVDHVFAAFYDPPQVNFNPEEVDAVKWVCVNELKEALRDNPQAYTPWLKPALELLEQSLVKIVN